jgi:hypothetical protein
VYGDWETLAVVSSEKSQRLFYPRSIECFEHGVTSRRRVICPAGILEVEKGHMNPLTCLFGGDFGKNFSKGQLAVEANSVVTKSCNSLDLCHAVGHVDGSSDVSKTARGPDRSGKHTTEVLDLVLEMMLSNTWCGSTE